MNQNKNSNVQQAGDAISQLLNKSVKGPRETQNAPQKNAFSLSNLTAKATSNANETELKIEEKIVENTTGALLELLPDDVYVDPQVRKIFKIEQVQELAENILAVGQLQPGVVEANENGKLTLIIGERRLRAIKLLREQGHDIKYLALKANVPKLLAQLSENIQRENLSPLEEANAFEMLRLRDQHTGEKRLKPLAVVQLAKVVHKSRQFVSDRLSLLEYHSEVSGLVEIKGVKDALFLKALNGILDENLEFGQRIVDGLHNDKVLTRAMATLIRKIISGSEPFMEGKPCDVFLLNFFAEMITNDVDVPKLFIDLKTLDVHQYEQCITECINTGEVNKQNLIRWINDSRLALQGNLLNVDEEIIQPKTEEVHPHDYLVELNIENVVTNAQDQPANTQIREEVKPIEQPQSSSKGKEGTKDNSIVKPDLTNLDANSRIISVIYRGQLKAYIDLSLADNDPSYIWIRDENESMIRAHVNEIQITSLAFS